MTGGIDGCDDERISTRAKTRATGREAEGNYIADVLAMV